MEGLTHFANFSLQLGKNRVPCQARLNHARIKKPSANDKLAKNGITAVGVMVDFEGEEGDNNNNNIEHIMVGHEIWAVEFVYPGSICSQMRGFNATNGSDRITEPQVYDWARNWS